MANPVEISFPVTGMSCGGCVARLEKALGAQDGVTSATVRLIDHTARVSYLPDVIGPQDIARFAADAGYPADLDADADAPADTDTGAEKTVFLQALALTLPVFILEMGGHIFPAFHHFIGQTIGHTTSWVIQFILTSLVLIGPGRGFFTKGFPALFRAAPDMNSLVALGAGAAWLYSSVVLFLPALLPQMARAVYFEAAAVIVTLILLGRWLEARAKGQAGAAVQKLIGLQPKTALVQDGEGWREAPIAELRIGEVIQIKPGARIPTDAQVLSGRSTVDESMISGEPVPVAKSDSDPVTGGTVNGTGNLICRVTAVGEATAMAQIIRMVQQAQDTRLPVQALVNRIALWFVPAVLGIALLTVGAWLVFGPSPALPLALVTGVSVLIIACPCAMGLATPTSIMVGTGRAAQMGVLFRKGDALQTLRDVRTLVMDKTGTLTRGQPTLTTVDALEMAPDDLLTLAASVEALSEHPLAAAIVAEAEVRSLPLQEVADFEAHTGKGVAGRVGDQMVQIGNAAMMQDLAVDTAPLDAQRDALGVQAQTVFFVAVAGRLAGLLAVSDPIKETTPRAIAQIKALGVDVVMMTGDAQDTAQAVADQLGITDVLAGALPADKARAITQLQTRGPVAFVGDGLNDAPALAQADVGIAIGTGTDIAIEAADVVLMSGDLQGAARAITVSQKTMRNIKQNLFWAFGYNVALVPVAAGVLYAPFGILLSPMLAAGAMACSSVFVVLNALRLRGMAPPSV